MSVKKFIQNVRDDALAKRLAEEEKNVITACTACGSQDPGVVCPAGQPDNCPYHPNVVAEEKTHEHEYFPSFKDLISYLRGHEDPIDE